MVWFGSAIPEISAYRCWKYLFWLLWGCGNYPDIATSYLIWISAGFALGEGVGKKLSWQLGHSSLLLFFSNSDTCQVMAPMALANFQQRCSLIPLPWPKSWALGNCPGAWAVTAVDIRCNFGNYQGFMYEYSGYWWEGKNCAMSKAITLVLSLRAHPARTRWVK